MKSKIVTMGLACSLSIASLFIFGCSGETYEALEWPDSGLFTQVPDPGAEYGTIGLDLDDTASATVDQITKEDWQNYVEECKNLDIRLMQKKIRIAIQHIMKKDMK